MTDLLIILHEYTEILLGTRKNYSDVFFDSDKGDTAAAFVRLAVKTYLQCDSMAAAAATINMDILERMKLRKIIDLIKAPPVVPDEDRKSYVIAKIFMPGFNEEEWVNQLFYQKIKKQGSKGLKKNYLNCDRGKERCAWLLNICMKDEFPAMSTLRMYEFSTKPEFRTFLKERGLLNASEKFYSSPVELMHDSLDYEVRDESVYNTYQMLYEFGI